MSGQLIARLAGASAYRYSKKSDAAGDRLPLAKGVLVAEVCLCNQTSPSGEVDPAFAACSSAKVPNRGGVEVVLGDVGWHLGLLD